MKKITKSSFDELAKMKYFLCVFLLFLLSFSLSAQRYISGCVTNADGGEPIPGVSVFIANTTVGTSTDNEGNYRLKLPGEGSYRLVVSHVAYDAVFRDIEPDKESSVFDVAMRVSEMREVEVSVKVKARKTDQDLFWKTILGTNPSKKTIYPTNPEDVYFFYNNDTKKLTVSCLVPLYINNNETGYQIKYVLNHFMHDYNTKLTSWAGEPFFEELEPKSYKQKDIWKKNRQKVYQFSIRHFIKSLYHKSLGVNGFLLTHIGKGINPNAISPLSMPDPEDFLSSNDEGCKLLCIPPDSAIILVSYNMQTTDKDLNDLQLAQNRLISWSSIGLFRNQISTTVDTVCIYADGTYSNSIRFTPLTFSLPLTGLNMMLPIEYTPVVSNDALRNNEYVVNDSGQTLENVLNRFDMQLALFPQQKVYLHTDKSYYVSGERIWFRAHVVDAASHIPLYGINSIYVELFNMRDSVVSRVKTGPANHLFSGYISIPEDIPLGDYTIRAYTGEMRNLDEDYFFMKNIHIGNYQSRKIQVFPEYEFISDKKIGADMRFVTMNPFAPPAPKSAKISINGRKSQNVNSANGVFGVSFNLPSGEKQRVMLLNTIYDQHPYCQYFRIPLPDDDFDVSFYPEGGSSLYGCVERIAVKAMQRDGMEIDVNGVVYDRQGNEITQFKTDVRGMGQFMMTPLKAEESYYAVCNHKGQIKRFELPVAKSDGYALSALWNRDFLIVKALQPESHKTGDTLFLIIHTRGVIQDAYIWENTNEPMIFRKDLFLSGVSNLLLLSKDIRPISERLVFVNNNDQANVISRTDKDAYSVRSPVEYTVSISDESGEPLEGSFSVSVTSDHEVTADTTANILTQLLLTSDLRGNISKPSFYFQNSTQSAYALDLLMLTQGWRRYDMERMIRNDLIRPDTLLKYVISGTVKNRYLENPIANAKVSILSLNGDHFAETITDSKGRFYLSDGNATDSTMFIVQATIQRSDRQNFVNLALNDTPYPTRSVPVVSSGAPDREIFAIYADKTEQQYEDEHGTRIIQIEEVTITAKKKYEPRSLLYFYPDRSITIDDSRTPPTSVCHLLSQLPGVYFVHGDEVRISKFQLTRDCPPLFLLDGFPVWDDLLWLDISTIEQVDLLTSPTNLLFFGVQGSCGVIAIYTRSGAKASVRKSYYTQKIMPLGFQKPVEFYAPKYDTPAQNTKPDLRTTIHWQPNFSTNETGTASFSFYTADTPSIYTVVIEGVTDDGKIVYKRDKIVVDGK